MNAEMDAISTEIHEVKKELMEREREKKKEKKKKNTHLKAELDNMN